MIKHTRVLIVEDNECLLDFLCGFLQLNKLEIICYPDAPQLKEVLEKQPDIAIFDIFLPNGNGAILAKQLRKKNHDVKIILTSTDMQTLSACSNSFADAVLPKPFSSSEMLEVLSKFLPTNTQQK